jgi:hypothetical protein
MVFEGPCIVVQLTETDWYVAAPTVAQPGEYRVVSTQLGGRDAFKRCNELNELEDADWSRRLGLECGRLEAGRDGRDS